MFCPNCGKDIPEGSSFCLHCGKATTAAQVGTKKGSSLGTIWKAFAIVVIVVGAIFVLAQIVPHSASNSTGASSRSIGSILHPPVVQKIFSGQLVVKAGQYRFWTVTISPQMTNAELIGSFHASGGSGNDIQAVISNQSEFENWKNGHKANVYYGSGKTTNGQFNVRLAPGTYVLAFSNAFSLITNKEVTADVELHYLR